MEQHLTEHLTKVSLEEFVGQPITKIDIGTELFYLHEVNKYLEEHGLTLDFSDLKIDASLKDFRLYAFFTKRYPTTKIPDISATDYNFKLIFPVEATVAEVKLKPVAEGVVEYDYYYDYNANGILHKNNASTGFVSLLAYLKVQEFVTRQPMPTVILHVKDDNTPDIFNDTLILTYYGHELLKDKVIYKIYDKEYTKQDLTKEIWSAYHYLNNQRGYMPTFITKSNDKENRKLVGYSTKEKYKKLKDNYIVGDVVFLYERTKTSESNNKASIKSCNIAVIKHFDQNHIKLEQLISSETWASQYLNCEILAERDELEGTSSITPDDYTKNIKYETTHSLTEIGVDELLRYEHLFILDVNDFDRGTHKLYVQENGKRLTEDVDMGSVDYVYTLLEERGVEYNKKRFLSKHLKGRTPVYEQYREYQK